MSYYNNNDLSVKNITNTQINSFIKSTAAESYYVDVNAATDGNGTAGQPWNSVADLQKAMQNGSIAPGSTIYFAPGTYKEQLNISNFNKAGTNAKTTFTTWTQSAPVAPPADAKGTSVIFDASQINKYTHPDDKNGVAPTGVIQIDNSNYIEVNGFEITGMDKNASTYMAGISVYGSGGNISLENNNIHDFGTSDKIGADGIGVYGTSKDANGLHDIHVDNNTLNKLILGASESLTFNGNVNGFWATDNTVENCDNIGIDAIGDEGTCSDAKLDIARNGHMINNTITDCSTLNNTNSDYKKSASSAGAYVDGGEDIEITDNKISGCDLGVEVTSEHAGKDATNVTVTGNQISNSYLQGLSLGGDVDGSHGGTTKCTFENNTLTDDDTSGDGSGEISLNHFEAGDSGNVISNNIITVGGANTYAIVDNNPHPTTTNAVVSFSGNTFTPDSGILFSRHGTDYNSFQDWLNAVNKAKAIR